MSREQAIECYILVRLRAEEIKRLSFLVEGLHKGTIQLERDAPFTPRDLKDVVRTAFFGWFATLTDRDDRAVYAFDPLLVLFPGKRQQIINVQSGCEACHSVLQQFRNNVAFHIRGESAAYFKAHRDLREKDTFPKLESARTDFQCLMAKLISEELSAIPELPEVLTKLGVSHHPAFANLLLGGGGT